MACLAGVVAVALLLQLVLSLRYIIVQPQPYSACAKCQMIQSPSCGEAENQRPSSRRWFPAVGHGINQILRVALIGGPPPRLRNRHGALVVLLR